MSVQLEVLGSVALLSGAASAGAHFYLLKRRRASPVRQVISAPAGWLVRGCLLIAVCGVLLLTSSPAVVIVEFAIVAWELTVQVTAWVKRARRRRAPRAS